MTTGRINQVVTSTTRVTHCETKRAREGNPAGLRGVRMRENAKLRPCPLRRANTVRDDVGRVRRLR